MKNVSLIIMGIIFVLFMLFVVLPIYMAIYTIRSMNIKSEMGRYLHHLKRGNIKLKRGEELALIQKFRDFLAEDRDSNQQWTSKRSQRLDEIIYQRECLLYQ